MAIKIVNDDSLTEVANAIRLKAEISGTLEFPDGFVTAVENIPTGGGGLDLLTELPLGRITTNKATPQDTGKTITVTGVDDYDFIIFVASVAEPEDNKHVATVSTIALAGNQNTLSKNEGYNYTPRLQFRKVSGVMQTYVGDTVSTQAGVYPGPAHPTFTDGTYTFNIYDCYIWKATRAIDGDYTMRVYGLKISNLVYSE